MSTNIDPSRTIGLRRRFAAQMAARFGAVRSAVWQKIQVGDALGLVTNAQEWRFLNDPQKVKAFRDWLQGQVAAGLLIPEGVDPSQAWTAEFIYSAYRQGLVRAYNDANPGSILLDDSGFGLGRRAQFLDTTFAGPVATQQLELLYTRAFNHLQGVTDAMANQLSAILADGLARGLGPYDIARNMVEDIDNITERRAKLIARTEIIRSHAEGQLDSLEALGIAEVGILVEWATAADPCPLCADNAGEVYTIEEARGLIPLHPNCRCAWVPHLMTPRERRQARRKQGV
jgi:SPP1 gp7 family putative phage head morphogenesis protein